MNIHIPRRTYVLPVAVSLALAVSWWMLQNYAANNKVWQSIPFGWLLMLCLTFSLGLLVQDAFTPDSWIRAYIADYCRIFTIDSITPAHKSTPAKEWLEVMARIRFLKNLEKARMVIRVYSCVNVRHASNAFVLVDRQITASTEHVEECVLAILPLKSYDGQAIGYQHWGSEYRESGDVDGIKSFLDGSENIVEIELRSGRRRQREHAFVAALHRNSFEHGRVFIVHQGSGVNLRFTPLLPSS